MYELVYKWLNNFDIAAQEITAILLILALIFIFMLAVQFIMQHIFIKKIVNRFIVDSTKPTNWWRFFVNSMVFKRLLYVIQGFLLYSLIAFLPSNSLFYIVASIIAQAWILLATLLFIFLLLDTIAQISENSKKLSSFPTRGVTQGVKLAIFLIFAILFISLLIGKSPIILLSGLGAMSAVTMLVFKDAILGFVAGLQLFTNDMLKVGDWLEMPTYGADGNVIEIGLTTVKVSNWDKTITTVPTYALISNSFKNWRGMYASGGRRIKRHICIDTTSIHFLTDAEHEKLMASSLLKPYLVEKTELINQHNQQLNASLRFPLNERRLTNIGTFRAYMLAYLSKHSAINNKMTILVRQLQPTENGLPIEIYAFTKSTDWNVYEDVQSDIFDHIYSVLEEFSLRVHQLPSGQNIKDVIGSIANIKH